MSQNTQTLLVATTNRKKLTELQNLLQDVELQLLCLSDCSDIEEVDEDGDTFEENAIKKAVGYASQTGYLTLAEDSGLCCDALEGAPGVYSARFAGSERSDHQNNLKLLRLLAKVPDNCRGAHFVSAVALAAPEKVIGTVTGQVHGVISKEIRGDHGFGYDSLFYYPPFGKNFGEVTIDMKAQVSHRGKALKKAIELMREYLRQGAQT